MSVKFQLKNGLNVILIETHRSPVVSVQMWVKTGSADETKGQEGISHFIEHLVFKGSDEYGVGEMANEIERSGGMMNAYTSFDQTVFYVTISRAFTDTGLKVISQMMGHPSFVESEIDNEREVVIEEIKRSMDNPHQRASKLLFSTAFKKHPYGIPVIGYAENIKSVSRKEIVSYYQSRYVPQNMTLLIVGDFNKSEMKKKVEKYFGSFKRHPLKNVKRKSEPPQTKPRWQIQTAPFVESLLYFSWPIGSVKEKDSLTLTLLGFILGAGESSRLNARIRNDRKIVNHIGASAFAPKDKGLFAVSAGLNNDRLKDVLFEVQTEILKVLKEGVTDEEIYKAKLNIESDKLYSMETVDGQASLFGHFEFLYNNYKQFDQVLKQLNGITGRDIVNACKKYLTPDKVSISYLTSAEPKQVEETIKSWAATFKKEWKKTNSSRSSIKKAKSQSKKKGLKWSIPKTVAPVKTESVITKAGIKLILRNLKDSPVVSLRAGFLAGSRAEVPQIRASNELLARTWAAGTKNYSEQEFNERVEGLASSVGAFGGRNTVGLVMTSLVPHFGETLKLFEDVACRPLFDEDVLAREKVQMLEALKIRDDKPAQICMLNLTKEIFAGHPYQFDSLGSADDVERLSRDSINQLMAKVISTENMVMSVVGDFSRKELMDSVDRIANSLHKKNEFLQKFEINPLEGNKHSFVKQEKEQTHLAIAFQGLKYTDEDRYTLDILQSILSGQGGRLFTELRDKASLAYTVAPVRMDGIEGGYFGAYIGCSPEKAEKALKMIRVEFNRLMDALVSDSEIERSKRYLLGRHDISLQKTASLADHHFFDTIYGLNSNELDFYQEKVNRVSADSIKNLAQKLFSQNSVVSIVGKNDIYSDH